MAGIIHLQHATPRRAGLTRRLLVLGAAGMATTASLDRGVAAQGTPAAGAAVPPPDALERLTAMLRMVPIGAMGGPDPDQWLFSWVDLETHFDALGVRDWRAPDVSITEITMPITSTDSLIQFALDEDAEQTFGFSALDASQILVAGNPPDAVTYYAGLPVDRLPAAWEAAGYQRMSGEYGEYWTAGQEGEVDLTTTISRVGVGNLNNVAILGGDVVVFTRTARLLQQVQGLLVDGGESGVDDAELAEALGTIPDDTVNLFAVPGVQLSVDSITPEGGQITGQDLLAASDDAVGPMPPVLLALFGLTAGARAVSFDATGDGTPAPQGSPDARFVVRLLMESPEDATTAAEVVAWRAENLDSPVAGYGYGELMTLETDPADAAIGNVAALDFSAVSNIAFWYRMLYMLDLWPFAWSAV